MIWAYFLSGGLQGICSKSGSSSEGFPLVRKKPQRLNKLNDVSMIFDNGSQTLFVLDHRVPHISYGKVLTIGSFWSTSIQAKFSVRWTVESLCFASFLFRYSFIPKGGDISEGENVLEMGSISFLEFCGNSMVDSQMSILLSVEILNEMKYGISTGGMPIYVCILEVEQSWIKLVIWATVTWDSFTQWLTRHLTPPLGLVSMRTARYPEARGEVQSHASDQRLRVVEPPSSIFLRSPGTEVGEEETG